MELNLCRPLYGIGIIGTYPETFYVQHYRQIDEARKNRVIFTGYGDETQLRGSNSQALSVLQFRPVKLLLNTPSV
jgi:hypothetical protein